MHPVVPLEGIQRALVVTAHPDDVDFGAAGTVATWVKSGIKVSYCICTSGECGPMPGAPREEVARVRRSEQLAAAAEVGVTDVTFLDRPDGALVASLDLRRDIARIIRTVRADRVLGWSPEINWEHLVTSHPDHRAAGEATLAAFYPDAGNECAHPELAERGFAPWSPRELWLTDSPPGLRNHAVDVTAVFPARLAALHAHRSQLGEAAELDDRMRERAARTAVAHQLATGTLAEAFQIVQLG